MGSSYPSNLDAFSTVRTTGQVVLAATDNDHSDAINKIEAELGTNPSGSAATVDARFNSVESSVILVHAASGVDTTGVADSTAAVQALINAADAKATLDFGDTRHNYKIASLTPKSGQRYVGRGATLTHKAGSTDAIFYWPQSPRTLLEDCSWSGLKFQGEVNDAAYEAQRCGVFVIYGHRMLVEYCQFYDFRSSAVHMSDVGDVTYDNLLVKRCSNGEELQFNSGNVGRNALELIGSALTDNEITNYELTARNCKVWINGASKGGAGGIVVNMRNAPYARATIDSNWVYDALNFCGIGIETWGRYATVTNNHTFGCLTGVEVLDTSGGASGATQINDRVQVRGNAIDCKCITPGGSSRPASTMFGALTVAYEADVPLTIGIWAHPSHGLLAHNTIRATNDGIRCLGTSGRHVVGTLIDSNTITIANTDAANRPFGMEIQFADSCTVSSNYVEAESGANFKDAYYFADVTNLTAPGNSSVLAGRNAIRLAGNVVNATLTGGQHVNPASNESANGVDVTATGSSGVHIGGGMRVIDTRGGSATMTNGISFSGALATSDTGELVLLGWITSAISGNTNVAVDQSRLLAQDKAGSTWVWGQNTQRRYRASAAPTTGTFSSGDRGENTSSQPGAALGWGCSASGTPGTHRVLGVIPGVATVATDAIFTLTALTDKPSQYHTGTLTANRVVTLAATAAFEGAKFRITRTGGGAFTLDVWNAAVGLLKSLATNTWGEFEYDGTAWKLSAYGAL